MRSQEPDQSRGVRRAAGLITSTGAVLWGNGINVTKTGTGTYTVRFTGFRTIIAANVTPYSGIGAAFATTAAGSNAVTVQTHNLSVNTDMSFNIAVEGLPA